MADSEDPLRLLAQGRAEEAEVACERRINAEPGDLVALNVLALVALRQSRVERAVTLLERGAALAPTDATTLHNLGRAREAAGDSAGALSADRAAVHAAPATPQVRLHFARSLERCGEVQGALLQYMRAIKEAQAAGAWNDAASTPPALRPLVEHAVLAIRTFRRSLLDGVLAPLVNRYGRSDLERVSAAVRVYLGEGHPGFSDPRQRPSFLYIPGLPTSPYFDRRLFAWLPILEARSEEITGELMALLSGSHGRERVFHSDELELENLRGNGAPPRWDGYYFYRHGGRRADNCAACPATAAAVDALPLIRIREHGPEVLFSVFEPGTQLAAHRGVTNARAVSHLPLIVPPDCALSVGGEVHAWRVGRGVVFDDTFDHEAWNRSAEVRVVLIADIWNPYLTESERCAINDVIVAIGDLRVAVDAA
jgi:aspartate beta-hydroxylase